MARTADVVIAGGGVVGTACAYFLARAGLRVHLLERDYFSAGTSRASHGGLALIHGTPLELTLTRRSLALWAEIAADARVATEYQVPGQVTCADTPEQLAAVGELVRTLRAAGIAAEMVDARGLRELEPNLAPDLLGGSYVPDEAMLQAVYAAGALADGARRHGAVLETGVAVRGIERGPDGRVARVLADSGPIETENVVACGGVWSPEIAALVGLRIPIIPRRGHVLISEILPERLYRHKIQELGHHGSQPPLAGPARPDPREFEVAFGSEQRFAGNVLIGTCTELVGFDRGINPAVAGAVARRAVRFVPRLAEVRVLRVWSGLRPHSPDHLPLIGPTSVPGFYIAAGHEGLGTTLAPITGQLISEFVTGRPPGVPLERLAPMRFEGQPPEGPFRAAAEAAPSGARAKA